ncbi:hypothetical protein HMPREF0501_00931 [Limosilactobacillus coleohominis 101-4-CHN]|uniref:Galactofuranosyltransferase n=1 Tax=Limosilactobacillus coleohominis 101-4-CHN TaxID=575594 RepID=C7XW37_9LACO|nr:hypothetical protein [Limosilactobacillus coleohominis]EEU30553.1 hypothetical protein HMPREF0501_00931 [Limosilactobacillus coleohominis 101-4-CHN]
MTEKVLLTFKDIGKNHAGPKATHDIELILSNNGFKSKEFHLNLNSKIEKWYYAHFYFVKLFKNTNIDELVVQYPVYSRYIIRAIIKNFRKYSNGKLYFIVHDLEGLRLYKDDSIFGIEEIEFLNLVDGIVAHNPSMKKYLEEKGVKSKITCLDFFDYLVNEKNIYKNQKNNMNDRICFAGNLDKAPFINKMSLNSIKLDVYGINRSSLYKDGIEYKGVFPPDKLPLILNEKFGLVWDGDSIQCCNGTYGNYIKYNSPHKASLYLSAGIPIIVWKQSALSELVKKYNLGLSVNNLKNIEEVLHKIPNCEYNELKSNAIQYSKVIKSGQNIIRAIESLEN